MILILYFVIGMQLFDISTWTEQRWWSTGGTRNKKIYFNPNDNLQYYFKQSLKKENKDYKYEFWSEIIASEIGLLCGFDVLPYHLAVSGGEVGCLSKSMIDPDKEELVEGGKYIQAFDNTFNPDDRKLRHQYDFDLIIRMLKSFQLERFEKDIIEFLVFDSLIGNSDRHQENWAFITEHSTLSKSIAEVEFDFNHETLQKIPNWLRIFVRGYYFSKGKLRPEYNKVKLLMAKSIRFSPIYDSGCSLGRELTDDRVKQLINNQDLIDAYINKGESEVHWKNKKISHLVLIKHLLNNEELSTMVRSTIERMVKRFDEAIILELMNKVDVNLPTECNSVKIPEERKQLMSKLVLSRFNRLKELI